MVIKTEVVNATKTEDSSTSGLLKKLNPEEIDYINEIALSFIKEKRYKPNFNLKKERSFKLSDDQIKFLKEMYFEDFETEAIRIVKFKKLDKIVYDPEVEFTKFLKWVEFSKNKESQSIINMGYYFIPKSFESIDILNGYLVI